MIPQSPAQLYGWLNKADGPDRQIYNTIVMLAHFLNAIDPSYKWFEYVKGLLAEYATVSRQAMGFPANWKEMALWA